VQQFAGGAAHGAGEVDGLAQAGADAASGGVKCCREADPVGVEVVVACCAVDERSQRVVHDEDNRAAVAAVQRDELDLVGIGVYGPRSAVDKVINGGHLHP